MPSVHITKLVAGGQGLGELADGRKIFVWGVLPGEEVEVEIISEKKSFAEGIAVKVITASPERIAPRETSYLAHSPWQIMTMAAENQAKIDILREQFTREHLDLTVLPSEIVSAEGDGYGYRNKMEYVFAEHEGELMLAHTERASHAKIPTVESALAMSYINVAAQDLLAELHVLGVAVRDVDSLVLRANQQGDVVAALYIKHPRYKKFTLPPSLKGLRVYFNNPRIRGKRDAKLIQELGENTLADTLLGKTFSYDVHSFFQVNVPVYEKALEHITSYVTDPIVDMYAGVGSIGLSVAKGHVALVELDSASVAMARRNAEGADVEVVNASTEQSLEYITGDVTVIFDPPRAGLHPRVVGRCLAVKPPRIIYLSCDPATLARDIALLSTNYDIGNVTLYNFFPRTPHIETLVVLDRKKS